MTSCYKLDEPAVFTRERYFHPWTVAIQIDSATKIYNFRLNHHRNGRYHHRYRHSPPSASYRRLLPCPWWHVGRLYRRKLLIRNGWLHFRSFVPRARTYLYDTYLGFHVTIHRDKNVIVESSSVTIENQTSAKTTMHLCRENSRLRADTCFFPLNLETRSIVLRANRDWRTFA